MSQPEIADEALRRFTALYEQVAPALCVWTMRHVSRTVQARIEIDDVLQETWMRAFRLRDRFAGPDTAFRAWIFAIAKNLLLEVQRSANKARRVQIDDGRTTNMLALEQISVSMTALSQRLVRDDGIRRFRAHLEELPREDQELVSFCGLEGSTAAEAARKLGIGVEAAHKRWQRLRARLREDGLEQDWLAHERSA
jgi:RNA polymerase sigma-70 factor (ECF subfamily)